jgi:mannonate dehydratase
MSNWFEDAGLHVSAFEGSVPLTDRIRMAKPGRDEDTVVFKLFLRDCRYAGTPTICYDWMTKVRWARTKAFTESPGGSLVTGLAREQMPCQIESADADVTED